MDTEKKPSRIVSAVKSLYGWYQGAGKELINEVPLVSSLLRDGFKTSEGTLAAALVGLIGKEALKDNPNPWILGTEALALLGIGIYAMARGNVKAAVVSAAPTEETVDPVSGFLGGGK